MTTEIYIQPRGKEAEGQVICLSELSSSRLAVVNDLRH